MKAEGDYMFKKVIKGLMSISVVLSSFGLIAGCACDDPEDEFPSAYNAEFEEYSAKVVTIMDKIGVLDAATIGIEDENEGSSVRLLSNTYSNNNAAIWDILENTQDAEVRDLYYTFQDAFEQSYFIPLIVGRAISEYYGEANFYGVKVNTPWNQYVETVKNGNVTTTSVYTPAGEVFDKETFIVMNMNYVSLENYTLSFILFNIDESRLYYFNLDHQGNLIAYSYNSDGEEYNNFILYSHDGFDGYEITDMTICNGVKALLIDEFRNVNKDNIRNIKNNVKHNIDSTKWDWASGYFFSGSGDGHVVDHYSFIDEGASVLASIGSDGSKITFTIPRNVRYLSTHLLVGNFGTDGSSDTITLVIPETIRGIKKYDDNNNIVDASIDELVIVTHDGKTLKNIQVAEGSPLFMAGEGDLKDLEGNIIYYMNKPVAGGVLDITNMVKKFAADPSRAIERDYAGKDLYVGSVNTANLEIESTISNYDLRMITSLFPNLRTFNITGEANDSTRIDARFATTDITINYNVTGKVDFTTDFQSTPTNHKLNILNEDAKIDYYDDANTVRATVPWSRAYHELLASGAPLWRIDINNITFETDPYAQLFENTEIVSIGEGLELRIDGNVATSANIPENYYGIVFNKVLISAGINNLYVNIPSTTTELYISAHQGNQYGRNITIEYDGTYNEFKNIIKNIEGQPFRINLICDGYNGEYGFGIVKVVLNEGVRSETYYIQASKNGSQYSINIPEVLMPSDANLEHYSYYYESEDGDRYDVISSGSYHGLEIILGENEELEDLVLTLKQESKLVTYHIIVNGNSLYSKELPYGSTIKASDIEENGVRKILFVINREEEVTYDLQEGEYWSTTDQLEGNNYYYRVSTYR